MRYLGLILILVFVMSHHTSSQLITQQINKGWQFLYPTNNTWYSAQNPSTIHMDLLLNKLIPDPYYGANQLQMYQLEPLNWVYQTNFTVKDANIQLSQNIELVFEGLDTQAEVFLNGELILTANNMFRKWVVRNVSQVLKYGSDQNNLTVVFYSAANHDIQMQQFYEQQYNISVPQNWSLSRKAAYQYGWDWGPRLVTCGIWKPVYIQAYNNTKIDAVYIRTEKISQSRADLSVRVDLFVSLASVYTIYITNERDHITVGYDFDLKPNALPNTTQSVEFEFGVRDPKLWWVRNLGNPELYEFSITIGFQNSQIQLDRLTVRTGIRQVKVLQPVQGNGTSFTVNLNGVDVYMKGGNWIPPKMFMPEAEKNPSVYNLSIQDAVNANFNMLRVWGGGQFELDIFYKTCDEQGLLIWHDLMFACNMYIGTPDWLENYREEMRDNLRRLRNHPSIALWNGNNEVLIGWEEWGWQNGLSQQQKDLLYGWYVKIFNETLPDIIAAESPDIFYWPTSPSASSSSTTKTITSGDIHFWQVWGSKANIELYTQYVGRFNSEYGMQAFPNMYTINQFADPQDRNLQSQVMQIHERGDNYWSKTQTYVGSYAGLELSSPFELYVYASQIIQSYALEMAIVSLRTARPYNMGSLYWQLNDVWPVVSWATVDYYGRWKAAHYKIKHLYENFQLLVYPNATNSGEYLVYAVNDGVEEVSGNFAVQIMNFDGSNTKLIGKLATVKPLSAKVICTIASQTVQDYKSWSDVVVSAVFLDNDGKVLTRTLSNFGRPLTWNLPDPQISLTFNLTANSITLTTQNFAKAVYIYTEGYTDKFSTSENYFDMLPQSSKTIRVTAGNLQNLKQKIKFLTFYDVLQSSKSKAPKISFLQQS